MLIYAEPADLRGHPDGDPTRALRAASALVRRHTITARYRVDPEGYPADPDVRAAFREAVVSQVETWTALGVDPATGVAGATGSRQVASKSLGSASVSYTVAGRAVDDLAIAAVTLDAGAAMVLDAALTDRRIEVIG